MLGLDVLDQVADFRGRGGVERRRRLVEDEQGRPLGDRHRDDDALLLAARDLMREALHHGGGLAEPDAPQEFVRPATAARRDRPGSERRTASSSCSPNRMVGFRAVLGSW